MAADPGTLAKMAIGATSTVDIPLDFISETLAADEQIIDTNGVRGTRERSVARLRPGLIRIGGQIVFRPSPVELAGILAWAVNAVSTNDYIPSNTLPSKFLVIDRVTKVYTYSGVAVNGITISGRQGEPIEVTLDVVAQTETVGNAGTFPSLTLDVTTSPFVYHEAAIVLAGTSIPNIPEFSWNTTNGIDLERFFTSRTLTATVPLDRNTKFTTSLPHGDYQALYNTGLSQTGINAGVACTITLTNANCSLVITMPKLTYPRKSPTVGGRSEIFFPIEAMAMQGSDLAVPSYKFTLDATP